MSDRQSGNGRFDPAAFLRDEKDASEAGPAAKAVDNVALLPAMNDPYKAAGFADSEVNRLVLVMGRDGFRIGENAYVAFQYVHIDIGQFGFTANGQVFSFVISGLQPKLVTVHGRNVLKIFDQISLRRIPWIRQADHDYRAVGGIGGTESIITKLEVEDWRRMPEQAAKLEEVLELHDA